MNYVQETFNDLLDGCKIIPLTWGSTKSYTINFEGWGKFSLISEYSELSKIIKMASLSLSAFISIYKDTHAFSEPMFCYSIDKNTFSIKISTLEIEEYDRRMEKYEQ